MEAWLVSVILPQLPHGCLICLFALVVHVDNLSYANLSDFIYYFSYSSLTGVGKRFDLIYQCLDVYSSLSPSLFIT